MLPKLLLDVSVSAIRCLQKRCYAKKNPCVSEMLGKVGILGVPFGKGQNKEGKAEAGLKTAPVAIRKTGFSKILTSIGIDVVDFGDVRYEPECGLVQKNMNNLDHFSPCAKAVSQSVKDIIQEGRSCLVLGGDHSIAVGSINAHIKVAGPKKIAVIYVDAHTDINTDRTSPTGNLHGMTVALLSPELKDSWSCVTGMDWLSPSLCLRNLAYIGTRSVDPGEVKFLTGNNALVYSVDDIEKLGIHTVLCMALEKIDPTNEKSIHVSFDIDALDYFEAPCTTVPVRGGLTLREGISLAEMLHRTGRVTVVDLVEVNAAIGNNHERQLTLDAAKHILLGMYGYSRRGSEKK